MFICGQRFDNRIPEDGDPVALQIQTWRNDDGYSLWSTQIPPAAISQVFYDLSGKMVLIKTSAHVAADDFILAEMMDAKTGKPVLPDGQQAVAVVNTQKPDISKLLTTSRGDVNQPVQAITPDGRLEARLVNKDLELFITPPTAPRPTSPRYLLQFVVFPTDRRTSTSQKSPEQESIDLAASIDWFVDVVPMTSDPHCEIDWDGSANVDQMITWKMHKSAHRLNILRNVLNGNP